MRAKSEARSSNSCSDFYSSLSLCFSLYSKTKTILFCLSISETWKFIKKAKFFHLFCLQILEEPKPTNYVRDQLGRASMSNVLNIAEGSGKFSKPDRRSFFVIARASIFECVAIFDFLHDQNKVRENDFEDFIQNADELSRILFAMIKNLE